MKERVVLERNCKIPILIKYVRELVKLIKPTCITIVIMPMFALKLRELQFVLI